MLKAEKYIEPGPLDCRLDCRPLDCVGHLKRLANGIEVKFFENIYADHPLPFEDTPSCIEVVRIEAEHAA